METKNYYPLRIGKYSSVIVSDTYPQRPREPDEREVEHYGGYLIAESVPSGLAHQLVDAYNEKYGPKDRELDMTAVWEIATKYNVTAPVALAINDEIRAAMKPLNSAHSFTEGMDVPELPKIDFDSPDFQAGLLYRKQEEDEKIKSLIGTNRLVDVEKVIEDLVDHVKKWGYTKDEKRSAIIQNAEAALGMLQAFKVEREQKNKEVSYTVIIKTLRKCLQDIEAPGNVNGIIWSIEELIKLRTK